MFAKLFKLKLFLIFSPLIAFSIKYLFIDDPEVNKFIKVAHFWLKFERYFSGVGYDYFNRDNLISRLKLYKTIKENDIDDEKEILRHYEIPSLIDDSNVQIKLIANNKIFNEKNNFFI